jgi:hypothetical protein
VLHRGIVIDADVCPDVKGLSLDGVDTRFVVSSIDLPLGEVVWPGPSEIRDFLRQPVDGNDTD